MKNIHDVNQRIKELMIAATVATEERTVNGTYYEVDLEKFAELIIQECIEIVEPCKCGCVEGSDEVGSALRETVELIKKHFGVEE